MKKRDSFSIFEHFIVYSIHIHGIVPLEKEEERETYWY